MGLHDAPLITVRRDGRRYVRVSTAEYVDARTDRTAGPDACWPWGGLRNKKGYGICTSRPRRDSGGSKLAHRISYEVAHGPIPPGMSVLHRCDNPPCVNPAHLFLGSSADNTRDMMQKGRGVAPCGEANGKSTVTDAQVREVRRLGALGLMQKDIAVAAGVNAPYVSRILNGLTRMTLDTTGGKTPSVGVA